MSETGLALARVTKRFGGTVAVDAVSATVEPGLVTALIGPNGAGKSTLVGLIAGATQPDAGHVLWRGAPVPPGAWRAARRGIGRLFQEVRLFPSLTALENVMAGVPDQRGERLRAALLTPRRVLAREREVAALARERLAFVGLADQAERLASELSWGQQKLVAIARLLATGADLLLLDEPASGVHPRVVDQLASLLRDLAGQGKAVLLVEHNMGLVRAVADQVLLLDRGRLVDHGPTQRVWAGAALHEAYLGAEPS